MRGHDGARPRCDGSVSPPAEFIATIDQEGDAHLAWNAATGYRYRLQGSDDLVVWQNEGDWPGFGQTVDLEVFDALPGGGGAGGPALPNFYFFISPYSDGNSLISWRGADGLAYQVYAALDFFTVSIAPLYTLAVEDALEVPVYNLVLISGTQAVPPNHSELSVEALPLDEQAYYAHLADAYEDVVDAVAINPPGGSNQSGVLLHTNEFRYFRLLIHRLDSDGDGLFDDQEEAFNTNPFDPDTDQDGVIDPWDLAALSDVVISEFMADNEGTLMDEDGDFRDWIELYNPTSSSKQLDGRFLSDTVNNLGRWQIPAGVTLAPGESLVIFASNKNRVNPAANLHTNFALSDDNESVYLSTQITPGTFVIDDSHVNYGPQRSNTSAGWGLDQVTGQISRNYSPSQLRFFFDPTPGAVNSPVSCSGFTVAPAVDVNGGVFSGAGFTVNMSTNDPEATVHYTLDASNPDVNSPVADGPISVDSTTILRAVATKPGCEPSPIVARSYLFIKDVIGTAGPGQVPTDYQVRPEGYPVYFRDLDNDLGPLDYAMDPAVIAQNDNYTTLTQELTAAPTVSLTVPVEDLFGGSHGVYANSDVTNNLQPNDPLELDWRRVASVEYIDPSDPGAYVQDNAELTISGATSRKFTTTDKHNLRLIFKSRLSVEGAARFEFAIAPFAGSPVADFNQLLLRSPTHDSWALKWEDPERERATHIREAWARAVHRAMDPPPTPQAEPPGNLIAHRRWVHLYINGLHWGIYELGERVDEDFARSHGDRMADYDVLKEFNQVVDGDRVAWDEMILRCQTAAADSNNGAKWAQVEDILDLDNYIDYLIVNMFMQNDDWYYGNNWRALRRRSAGSKFKFLIWDAEYSMDPTPLAEDPTTGTEGALEPHGILLDHPSYQEHFRDRVELHFHTVGGGFSIDAGGTFVAAQHFQNAMDDFQLLAFTDANKAPAFTFSDPSYLPGDPYFGDWDRATRYYRDIYFIQRRAQFLTQLDAQDLAPPEP